MAKVKSKATKKETSMKYKSLDLKMKNNLIEKLS